MQHLYTPIFKGVLTSRIWTLPDAHLRVWLWLQLEADFDGYVCADDTRVALGARVSEQDAHAALEALVLPIPDTPPLIVRLPVGWLVPGVVEAHVRVERYRQYDALRTRERAKAANDVTPVGYTDEEVRQSIDEWAALAEQEKLTEGTQASTSSPLASTEGTQEAPLSSRARVGSGSGSDLSERDSSINTTVEVPLARVIRQIPIEWQPSEELRQEALMAGVLRFDEQLASLRMGPIGGARGIFDNKIEGYIRGLFGTWRTWEENQRARAAAKPRGQGYRPVITLEPTSRHRAYAKKHGLPLDALVKDLVDAGAVDDLGAKRALEMLGENMGRMVRAQCDELLAKRNGAAS
jgi:hypothetical protein